MALGGVPSRKLRAAFAAALVVASLTLSACASSYAGIPFAPGAADPELQHLARRAHAGDKRAQLELGIRYEEGRGVDRNVSQARKLYLSAAMDRSGVVQVYSPSVGKGRGRLVPVRLGRKQAGLAEARVRLERLR